MRLKCFRRLRQTRATYSEGGIQILVLRITLGSLVTRITQIVQVPLFTPVGRVYFIRHIQTLHRLQVRSELG